MVSAHAAPPPKWEPVAANELSETAPRVENGAGAEAIFYRTDIDDRKFPKWRIYRTYVRFKIYDPDRVAEILSTNLVTYGGRAGNDASLSARLTLPSGQTREFGKESFLERTTAIKSERSGWWFFKRSRSIQLKERFLAISGVERGAVLEYQVEWRVRGIEWEEFIPLQLDDIPIRQLRLSYVYDSQERGEDVPELHLLDEDLGRSYKARTTFEKNRMELTAENLPATYREPYAGPASDYALTLMIGSRALANASDQMHRVPASELPKDPRKVFPGVGPWSIIAYVYFNADFENARETKAVKAKAAELIANSKHPLESARRIHKFVQTQRYEYSQFAETATLKEAKKVSLDDVLDFRKAGKLLDDGNFLFLALALYRAAGLDAHSLALPDRSQMRFNHRRPMWSALPERCIGLWIEGRWVFSSPHTSTRMPLNLLSWNHEGQVALVSRAKQQEFINVPAASPDQSFAHHHGTFKLAPNGTLTGECRSSFNGHLATGLRRDLQDATEEDQKDRVMEVLKTNLTECELEVTKIAGVADVDQPISINYKLTVEGYASFTKQLIVLRPSVFRSDTASPFHAATRRVPVNFPFRWKERDEVVIEIPEGYTLAEAYAPRSYPGDALHYKLALTYLPKIRQFTLIREYTSNAIEISVRGYEPVKRWFDGVAESDHHEIAFKRVAPSPAAPAASAQANSPSSTQGSL